MASETRVISGQPRDLSYMMALYLMGPTAEEHIIPLPSGTRIHSSIQENGDIALILSEAALELSESELTLASACLAMTCFDITQTEKVVIQNGSRSISMTRENLLLVDSNAGNPTPEETK